MKNNKQSTEPMVISQTSSTNTAQGIYVKHIKKEVTMSNNKQASVDIIYQGMSDKIVMQDLNKALICIHISHDDFLKLHKQAKAMHKEEIDDAYFLGYGDHQTLDWHDLDEHYNETFGE